MIDAPPPSEYFRPKDNEIYVSEIVYSEDAKRDSLRKYYPLRFPTRRHLRPDLRPKSGTFLLKPGDRFVIEREKLGQLEVLKDNPELQELASISNELLKGVSAWVLEGRDLHLGKDVVYKILKPDQFADLDLFYKEARLLANLEHPSIPKVYGLSVFEVGKGTYLPAIIMEKIEGRSAVEIKPDEHQAIIRVTKDIADVLDFLETRGIKHLDVKPENIKINSSGRAILFDFLGVVGDYRRDLHDKSNRYYSTKETSPPEISHFDAQELTSTVSVYELARTIYFILGGEASFEDKIRRFLRFSLKPLKNVPEKVNEVFKVATHHDPSKRYNNCTEFANDLTQALNSPRL